MKPRPLRISEVSLLLGVSQSFLRRAEQAGHIPAAYRDAANQRRYSLEDVGMIGHALLARAAAFHEALNAAVAAGQIDGVA